MAVATPVSPAGSSGQRAGVGAFRSRSFTLYWVGSIASNVGSWMQVVATGWLVLQLTNSAADLGITAALQGLPILLFALVGGVVADRFDRYWLMVGAQVLNIVPDTALAVLVATHQVRIEHVFAYSLINGLINGLASPARRALVPHLVKREALLSALALDGTVWQGAAVVGPMLAGITIAGWGLGAPFYVNVFSDLLAIVVLLPIKERAPKIVHTASPWQNVLEGTRYSWRTKSVRSLLLLTAAMSVLGRSYVGLAPVFAEDVFHAGSQGLGVLTSAPAIGTVAAAFGLAFAARSASRKWFVLSGMAMSLLLVGYAAAPFFPLALGVIMLVGATGSIAQTLSNTLIQQTVAEELRGRVMSLFMASTLAAWRLAALPFGFAAQYWGAPAATAGGAVLLFLLLIPSAKRESG